MRFFPAEPDIATIFNRIVDNDIDLQPDFQRGEVWTPKKQKRLIDSILRGWVIPPILLISNKGGPQQVLDGQQRLVSIRDFKLNKLAIDGNIEPVDSLIKSLHGAKYHSLPVEIAKAFDRTTLRIYEITDYSPEEPAEIFFRLNQPTTLTSAEKRNAFFGPVRDQIRALVQRFELEVPDAQFLGFSNSRMAYDDVFARLACTIELGTLRKKITEAVVNDMYRRVEPLSGLVVNRLNNALDIAINVLANPSNIKLHKGFRPRLNKATFFSWLLFFARLDQTIELSVIADFFFLYERNLQGVYETQQYPYKALNKLIDVYTDRATARVADVNSILLRDFILWINWFKYSGETGAGSIDPSYKKIEFYYSFIEHSLGDIETELLSIIEKVKWGETV